MTWEYLVLKVKGGMLESDDAFQTGPNGGSVGRDNLNATMNKLGAEGWEGYSTVFDGKGINEILFKRQK